MHYRVPVLATVGICLAIGMAPVAPALAQRVLATVTNPAEVGFSAERLKRITSALEADVKAGVIPGAVVVVGRKGRIAYFDSVGQLDPDAKTPMSRDGIFRIYSMTKPIVSVAAMMLMEEGRIALTDPVAKYIPEFAGVKVGVEKAGTDGKPAMDLVAPRRAMTVQDLLRHTSGLTYGFFGTGVVKQAYLDSKGIFGADLTNAEFAKGLATLPLMHQPGSTATRPMCSAG